MFYEGKELVHTPHGGTRTGGAGAPHGGGPAYAPMAHWPAAKATVCREWLELGACQYGSACTLAHVEQRQYRPAHTRAHSKPGTKTNRAAVAATADVDLSEAKSASSSTTVGVCIVDALNIGRWRCNVAGLRVAGKPQVKVRNIIIATKLIEKRGMRPIVMIPQNFLSNKLGLSLADAPEKLHRLEAKGILEVLPAGMDDDVAIIDRAKSLKNGFVLTNDLFRDHQKNGRITRAWYEQRVFRFSGNRIDGFYLHAPPKFCVFAREQQSLVGVGVPTPAVRWLPEAGASDSTGTPAANSAGAKALVLVDPEIRNSRISTSSSSRKTTSNELLALARQLKKYIVRHGSAKLASETGLDFPKSRHGFAGMREWVASVECQNLGLFWDASGGSGMELIRIRTSHPNSRQRQDGGDIKASPAFAMAAAAPAKRLPATQAGPEEKNNDMSKNKNQRSSNQDIPDALQCPITLEIFKDPVLAADGFNYERAQIEHWLRFSTRSPVTNATLAHKHLNPNHELRRRCRVWKQSHPRMMTPPFSPPLLTSSKPTAPMVPSTLLMPTITVHKVWFHGTGKHGDYAWMLRQPQYARTLMIYNENLSHHRDKTNNVAGSGNACARPFRASGHAIGIPTGHRHGGFQSLHQIVDGGQHNVKEVIDQAIAEIVRHVASQSGRFDSIFYCVNNASENLIGNGIFQTSIDVRRYITAGIHSLPEKISSVSTAASGTVLPQAVVQRGSSTTQTLPTARRVAAPFSEATTSPDAGTSSFGATTAATTMLTAAPVAGASGSKIDGNGVNWSTNEPLSRPPLPPRSSASISASGPVGDAPGVAVGVSVPPGNRPVIWACKSDCGWVAYPTKVSEFIEAAYRSGATDMTVPGYLLATGNTFSYLICFQGMKQINQTTGKVRVIRQAL